VDLERAGLAGELQAAQIIYLAATSRLFSQPLSVAVKGPSSGGKSYTVQNALRFLPQEACFTLTSASERALIYTDEDLHHRMLVLYEADAIAKGGRGAYLLRTLLSEGEIRHETVEKAGKGFATRKITKAGPDRANRDRHRNRSRTGTRNAPLVAGRDRYARADQGRVPGACAKRQLIRCRPSRL